MYLDGVYLGKGQGSIFDVVDLERVEILEVLKVHSTEEILLEAQLTLLAKSHLEKACPLS